MAQRTLLEAINEALRLEMAADDRVILLGEDIGREGGVFRVTEGLQAVYGPQRVVDTPLAESGIVGMAIGMAIADLRPVAEIQFMGFLYPALDQIINHVGRMRNRSRGRFYLSAGDAGAVWWRHSSARAPLGKRGGDVGAYAGHSGGDAVDALRCQGLAD